MQASTEQQEWVSRVLGIQPGALATPRPSGDARGPQPVDGGGETGFFDDVKNLVSDVGGMIAGADSRKATRKSLLLKLARLTDPDGATKEEKAGFKKERDAATKALAGEAPSGSELDTAAEAIARLAKLIEQARRRVSLAALGAKNPEAAKQARATLGKFDTVLGDTEVTPELVKETGEARAAKEKELAAALAEASKKLPANDPRKKKALEAYKALKAEADTLAERENAMIGRTSLENALSHGPLSSESGSAVTRPETAQKLIAAYGKDARIADAAVTAAGTAKFPDAIADNVDDIITRSQNGFAAKGGQAYNNRDTAREYGQNLLKMGGNVGPEYFARLPDYIASGQQFTPDGPGDKSETAWNKAAQKRSTTLAGKLIKPDGTIDVTSDAAKAAIGDQLFHPDAVKYQAPALSAHMLKTVDFLADPATGPQATAVLKGVTAPTNPAAQKLVRGSLGKGPADGLDDAGARTAVLASMLKPLDQGPVGSCFATAPTRKMRETQPLDAMKAYADIAAKGTYKPPFGPEVPVVTNLPAGEDPIMRSWEYTTATATSRRANSDERTTLAKNVAKGTDLLKDIAVKHEKPEDKDASWSAKKQKLTNDVADALTFIYDPTSTITNSSDGKSSTGRYIITRVSDNKEIRSQADFEAAITDVALASLAIDPSSPEATDVKNLVTSNAFIAAVCPGDYKPWELSSGGQTTAATQTLFGDTLAQKAMLPEATDPKPNEGDRTKQVLSAFLKNFQGNPAQMATIRTVGMHGFNALPNDPSLAALKGKDEAETNQKIQANLVDKGTALKNTDLSADRAAWLFDAAIKKEADAEKDATLRDLIETEAAKRRPTAAMKPAALTKAIDDSLEAYHDKAADGRGEKWKTDETAKGKTPAPADVTKKKAEIKKALKQAAENAAKDALLRNMDAPEFVIADSNWGGPLNHTFFVVAPDPTSGEPLLWEKTEPPGTMRPAGRDWVDHEWASIQ
jgi:hypothetical protein